MNYSSGITSDDEDMENQMVGNGASEARTNESEVSETLLDVANRMALAGEDTPMQEEATHEHKKQKQDHTGLPNPQSDKDANTHACSLCEVTLPKTAFPEHMWRNKSKRNARCTDCYSHVHAGRMV